MVWFFFKKWLVEFTIKRSKIDPGSWKWKLYYHNISFWFVIFMYTNLVDFFCLHQLTGQTMKRKEAILVVLNCRKKLVKRLLNVKLALNFTEYRLHQRRSQDHHKHLRRGAFWQYLMASSCSLLLQSSPSHMLARVGAASLPRFQFWKFFLEILRQPFLVTF